MSRIDEALRRAAALADDRLAPVVVEPRAQDVDESVLERYAHERPVHHQANPPAPTRPSVAAPARERLRPTFGGDTRPHDGKLVGGHGISPASVEQYRRLAATLHELHLQRRLKTLMVSSALPREGKTLTITNLALTLSESYRQRVLLIDADFRRPSIHDLFGCEVAPGLAEVLATSERSLPLVQVSPFLSVLTAGCHDDSSPLAELASGHIQAIVDEASARFEWVLLDTPPIGLLSDAQLIARACDGVLFVIAAGSTPYHLVQAGIAEVGADRVVGTLLNRVDRHALSLNDYYRDYHPVRGGQREDR